MTSPSKPYMGREKVLSDHNTLSILWDANDNDNVTQWIRHARDMSYLKQWINYRYLPKNSSNKFSQEPCNSISDS